MKNILVAIDFSPASLNALDYAINLASLTEANIMLIWVDNQIARDEFTGIKNEYRHSDIMAKLQELSNVIIRPRLKNASICIKTRIGKVEVEIHNQAKYSDMDCVICGTVGMGEAKHTGTNAFKIVNSVTTCPVIAIPPTYTWKLHDVNSGKAIIILPIDSTPETRQKTDEAIMMSQILSGEIHILGLYSTKLSSLRRKVDQYACQIEAYVKSRNISYKSTFTDADNITRSTLTYAETNGADIIIIMKEQETTTQNLFIGPYAQQMINNSPIPVMCISTKDTSFIADAFCCSSATN